MSQNTAMVKRPQVVVIGSGFAGLEVAKGLAKAPVDVLLLDRNNYFGFWPLLYQVATAGLEPQQIARPVRAIVRHIPNVQFRVANVEGVDFAERQVKTNLGTFDYDELVIAAGSATNFFGIEAIAMHGFDLKDLPEALALRNQLLTRFEQAVIETDPERQRQRLTFVIVGGGPTGVELAGAISELIRHVLRKDYPTLDFSNVQVVLLEATDTLLPALGPVLGRKAVQALRKMGVDVRLKTSVTGYQDEQLQLKDQPPIITDTVIWAAGVQGAALGKALGLDLERGGRIAVTPALQLAAQPNVWVVGDLAHVVAPNGRPYPQLATVAMQQGRLVARNLVHKLQGEPLQPFKYFDKGSMATIGRRSAVAHIWRTNWSGTIAWILWLGVHLSYLVGFRNRLLVLINWAYNYLTYERGSRAIISGGSRTGKSLPRAAALIEPVEDK